ncbi:DUF2953 domain-containing protein [Sporolactobacillus sp. THM7-4]|nr:DUF2953 domain-containing protein [Sporolactobacillus sp. THM7-4]
MLYLIILFFFITVLFLIMVILIKSTISAEMICHVSLEGIEADIRIYFWGKERWSFRMTQKEVNQFLTKENEELARQGQTSDLLNFKEWRLLRKLTVQTIRAIKACETPYLSEFSWSTYCGIGEARGTAMLCGLIWSVKSALMMPFREKIVGMPRVEVIPLFQTEQFTSHLSCMITIKIGDAIVIMRRIRQQMKEG